ncbi:putative serine/threonine-protein kinase [Hibiscus syriacus]|uniref:Serine/threonine-protein kinase n=1 Tax=Hibiscus syriacus TaxID=106335 RepID=A0A6A2Z6J9_HIBSY|nr:putative serine/threonine-protein kinase [Hibiscus syriacus]
MDSSALNQKSSFHARSKSLPSAPHPLIPQIDEHLCRLKSNEAATSSSSTEKLIGLRDLYDLVDGWLQLPSTQNFIVQNSNDNELLNGSLRLLDVCGLAKDALLQTKEDIQQLQSVFRRRRGDDAGLTNEAKAYLASRKKASKQITTVALEARNLRGTSLSNQRFERVSATLCSLVDSKTKKCSDMSSENARIELQKLETSIVDVEGVECLVLAGNGSLWVAWLHNYILKGQDFWPFEAGTNVSWGFKRILKLRPTVAPFFASGFMRTKEICEHIRPQVQKVIWQRLIWYPLHIPKHSLIAWMAILNKLPTRDCLERMRICTDGLCINCSTHQETRDHIFSNCSLAIGIWKSILNMNGMNFYALWDEMIARACSSWKGKSLLIVILKISWNAFIYFLWQERNQRLFQGRF